MADGYSNNGLYVTSVMFKALQNAHARYSVISGCGVTEDIPAGMSVDVAAGVIYAAGVRVTSGASAGLAINAAHASWDRYDVISVNASGTVVYTAGTASATPVPPEIPATSTILAVIYVAAAVTTILTAAIYDLRIFAPIMVSVPISTVMDWHKTLTGTPALPSNFVECNGQVLSDAESPLNGQTMPDLNVTQRFTRGAPTSGGTGGADTHTLSTAEMPSHTHTTNIYSTPGGSSQAYAPVTADVGGEKTTDASGGGGAHNNLPAYMQMVKIICVKN